MICLHCDGVEFEVIEIDLDLELQGENIKAFAPAFSCLHCKTYFMNRDQINVLRRSAAEEYKKKKNLTNCNGDNI